MDLERVIEEFNHYTKKFDSTIMEIDLKYHHSFAVMDLMKDLASRLHLSKDDILFAQILGLLHDIGRFEQFLEYHSFNDKNQDHADESCRYLFENGHIRDFIEEDRYDSILEKAIRYHNKLELPDDLTDRERLFCQMIRDMDKVDIYKQDALHFSYHFRKEEVSLKVLAAFRRQEVISKKDVKSKSDAILLILALLFDISYSESRQILAETKNFDMFLSVVEVEQDSQELWQELVSICYQRIRGGVI